LLLVEVVVERVVVEVVVLVDTHRQHYLCQQELHTR
jgi:hypothetical protein